MLLLILLLVPECLTLSFIDTLPKACEIFTLELFTVVGFYSCTTYFLSQMM